MKSQNLNIRRTPAPLVRYIYDPATPDLSALSLLGGLTIAPAFAEALKMVGEEGFDAAGLPDPGPLQ